MIGTMMVGNVFFVIIPNHWKLVRAKEAGREPDPRWNRDGKTRSVHNNYLTLPVLFAMLSNHFPFTYGHRNGWIVLVALMADRRARAALLQPAPPRPERVAAARYRGGGDRRDRAHHPMTVYVALLRGVNDEEQKTDIGFVERNVNTVRKQRAKMEAL